MTTRSPSADLGPLVSRRVACDLAGITLAALDDLIRRGRVRTERIKATVYVDLADVDRAAEGGGS